MGPNQWLMRDRYEQVDCFSNEEYARRWSLTRTIMAQHGVDLLLVLDAAREGHDTWLTGRKNVELVIVPQEGDVVAVLQREYPEDTLSFDPTVVDYRRYVKQKAPWVNRPGLTFIHYPNGDQLVQILEGYKPEKLGIVNQRTLSHELKTALDTRLSDIEIIDLKQALDSQKTIKSTEERVAIRAAARTLEQLHDILPFVVRPGLTVRSATQALKDAALDLGANGDLHIMLIVPGQMDSAAHRDELEREHRMISRPEMTLRTGDWFFTIVECGGYGGHQVAMGRIGCLGPATPELRRAAALAGAHNRYAASQMKPGNTLSAIVRAAEDRAAADGTHLRRMCWMHGLTNQGYYEQFAVNDYGMDWPLSNRALLHCHPTHFSGFRGCPEDEVMAVNTYIVTPNGGESVIDLDRYPLEIMEIDG